MQISSYSYEEYIHLMQFFYGRLVPGLIVGGFAVDIALKNLPEGERFRAISETSVCLPDVIQILTPCTVGNGRLSILDFGRFAVTMYETEKGHGIRVYLDYRKLIDWPEINTWYFRLRPMQEDYESLIAEIKKAGTSILSMHPVKLKSAYTSKQKRTEMVICPNCREVYPSNGGAECLACRGNSPYLD